MNVEEDEDPHPKKPRGKPAAKDNWLKGFCLPGGATKVFMGKSSVVLGGRAFRNFGSYLASFSSLWKLFDFKSWFSAF